VYGDWTHEFADESRSVFGEGVNWAKVADTVKALALSPLIGFGAAALFFVLRMGTQ